jgi:hypothetical protein
MSAAMKNQNIEQGEIIRKKEPKEACHAIS